MENKTVLAVVGGIFRGDAQHKGPALPQLEEKPSGAAPCAAFLQLLFSKGASTGKTKMRKYEILP